MLNINGKAYAMNIITPMPRWKTPILRLVFFAVGVIAQLQAGLKNLSFIHFARWVIIKHNQFPFFGGNQEKEDLHYDYLLFCSNFNGTWNQYIDAFSAALSGGLNVIWRWSIKFPMSVPITDFKRYVARVQFDTDYYYNGHPCAASNDVKAALRVSEALDEFAKNSQGLAPDAFATAYRRFLVRVQCDLGETGPAPVGV